MANTLIPEEGIDREKLRCKRDPVLQLVFVRASRLKIYEFQKRLGGD